MDQGSTAVIWSNFVVDPWHTASTVLTLKLTAPSSAARYSIFWQLPSIGGIDNPMLEDEREADNFSEVFLYVPYHNHIITISNLF